MPLTLGDKNECSAERCRACGLSLPERTGEQGAASARNTNNRDNDRLPNTIVAQITSTTHRALEATQVLIDTNLPEGKQSGLLFDSVVNCINVVTIEKSRVLRKIGNLGDLHIQQVNDALKVALELP